MSSIDRQDSEMMRIRLIFVIVVAGFVFLIGALMREQVFRASKYRSSSERQSMRRVRISADRGRILDRNGTCLADNRPSYCIAVYVEELRQHGRWKRTVKKVMEVLDDAARRLDARARTAERSDELAEDSRQLKETSREIKSRVYDDSSRKRMRYEQYRTSRSYQDKHKRIEQMRREMEEHNRRTAEQREAIEEQQRKESEEKDRDENSGQ